MIKIVVSGKRKSAVAKATISEGTGKVTINKRPYQNLELINKLMIEEPLKLIEESNKFDIAIKTSGGGYQGQIEASRLAIARALLEAIKTQDKKRAEEIKIKIIGYDRNMLVADTRRKEAYKPNDSKARAKRQKSYR
jgi:small subunit ribosomal protein S9